MADDIVNLLRYAARGCNHGLPNGAGDSFPDPTSCHGCLRLFDAADEIERLQRWKAEATAVIEDWEAVWEAAGSPGSLGDYKPLALAVELGRLDDEIEQFRQLGDTLAYWVRFGDGKEMHSAVHRWEQARRG